MEQENVSVLMSDWAHAGGLEIDLSSVRALSRTTNVLYIFLDGGEPFALEGAERAAFECAWDIYKRSREDVWVPLGENTPYEGLYVWASIAGQKMARFAYYDGARWRDGNDPTQALAGEVLAWAYATPPHYITEIMQHKGWLK
jgi:hypothetical protein